MMAETTGLTVENNREMLGGLETPFHMLGLDMEAVEVMLEEYLSLRNDCLRDSLLQIISVHVQSSWL